MVNDPQVGLGTEFRVVRIADAPQAVAATALLMQTEWPDYYGPAGPGDAKADLRARCNGSALPTGFVALLADGIPAATVALAGTSHGAAGSEGPWLVGLVTAPGWRGRGLASALVAAVEAEARHAGYARLYCTTNGAAGLLLRRGWATARELDDGYKVFWQDLR